MGQTEPNSLIFAFPGNYSISEAQMFAGTADFAENSRKPQMFAEAHLSHLGFPFEFLLNIAPPISFW